MKQACIIGFGAIGPIHAQGICAADNVTLHGVCDCDPKSLDKARADYPGIRGYSSFDEVLSDPAVDSVHICTPHYIHTPMALRALEAGLDVILEKPAAMNSTELAELEKAAAASKARLCVMLQNRCNPCVQKLVEILKSGLLGKIHGVASFLTWHRDEAYYSQAPWRGKWSTEGGALMINQAIHLLDLTDIACGGITSVTAGISNKSLRGIIEAEDTADAVFETSDGAGACFYATNAYPANVPFRLEISAERGTLHYSDNLLYLISDGSIKPLAADTTPDGAKSYWGFGHRSVIESFYNGGDYPSLTDALHVMKVLFAFYESAETGKPVKVGRI